MLKRWVKLLLSIGVYIIDRMGDAMRSLSGGKARPRGTVLYYHAIRPQQRDAFAGQMDLLVRLARSWRAEDVIQDHDGGFYAAVTFDDGYASVVENALPVLKKKGIPFTVFFPTGSWNSRPNWVKSPDHPFSQERVLSRDELVALANEPLVTLGSHSVNHPNFLKLDKATAGREFSDSKSELESVLGRPVDLFSFPHGAHNGALAQQAEESGYRRLFTIEPVMLDPTKPSVTIGRVAVEPDDWPMEFRLKLLGAYRWQTWFRGPVVS